jgi:hypothetical protein
MRLGGLVLPLRPEGGEGQFVDPPIEQTVVQGGAQVFYGREGMP